MTNGVAEAAGSTGATMNIRLEGTFDPVEAARTLSRVADLACERIVIDFSRVWEVSDVALAFLAGSLTRHPRSRGEVIGLLPRHQRLLQQLGAGVLVGRPRHADPI